MKKFYNAILEETKDGVSVCFPDFPGCVSGGENLAEAMKRGREALEFHIEGMLNDGETVPDESSVEALNEFLAETPDASCRIALLEIEVPDGERERINITMPRYILQRIDMFAGAMHRTRSAFLAEAALAFIRAAR